MKKGFTLIELLVVISIIGTLAALIVNNLSDARGRARDASKKQDMTQLKTALRLYYNDYQGYPTGNGLTMNGCGLDGTDPCTWGAAFTAGADDTIYMKTLPLAVNYQSTDADAFIAKITLENASDPDIPSSQANCPGGVYSALEFVVCAD